MFYRSGRLDTPIPDRPLLDPGAVPLAGVPFRRPHGSRPVPLLRRQLHAALTMLRCRYSRSRDFQFVGHWVPTPITAAPSWRTPSLERVASCSIPDTANPITLISRFPAFLTSILQYIEGNGQRPLSALRCQKRFMCVAPQCPLCNRSWIWWRRVPVLDRSEHLPLLGRYRLAVRTRGPAPAGKSGHREGRPECRAHGRDCGQRHAAGLVSSLFCLY